MKIALYLGYFNPFHNGHLEVIKTAIKDFKMDEVVIVPTMQNPCKEEKVLDIDLRRKIIWNSIRGEKLNSRFNFPYGLGDLSLIVPVDLIEKELIPPYYSYATLHALKVKYCNDEIYVLVGSDTMEDIPNWMHGGQIIQDYDFLIVDRSEEHPSSTKIRELVRKGEDISQYVNENVINLIKNYYK